MKVLPIVNSRGGTIVRGVIALCLLMVAFGCGREKTGGSNAQGNGSVRLAYFPNVTHAPALIGVARGDFQKALGEGVKLDPKVFNAGPEAMEALLANEVDVSFVGPSPAINTFIKSQGRAVRLLAGVCSGGAALVARADVNIHSIKDLDGKQIAVPQLGGTQDVSCRHFLAVNGLQVKDKGGTVTIMAVNNPDILALFVRKQIDAAWVPEPWAARLIHDTGARLVVDERDLWPDKKFMTTVLIARKKFLDEHPDQVEALLRAHLQIVQWLQKNADSGQNLVNSELKRLTGKALAPEILKDAWSRVDFTEDPGRSSVEAFAKAAADAGYLHGDTNISGLFDFTLLEKVRHAASTNQ